MTVEPEDLSLEEKVSLLGGHSFHSTTALPRAGVPRLWLSDGPHGVRFVDTEAVPSVQGWAGAQKPATCFPPAVAVANSWSRDVARRVGEAVGREARAFGVTVSLGPAINIKRTPLCGRNFEYYSEDPLLTGVLAAAHVDGLQSEGVGASLKHFAANNQETGRFRVSADVDERTLREIYLAAFEHVVVTARPATVMAAYNRINGVYCTQNPWLLTQVLREEWGFEGLVMSDWGAIDDRVAALEAGCDLEMPPNSRSAPLLLEAVAEGRLAPEVVDRAARRFLVLADRHRDPSGDLPVEEHHRLARALAAECIVLLKNDREALPLGGDRILVTGAFAVHPRFQGGGSSNIKATRVDAALPALEALAAARGGSVEFVPGFLIGHEAETASAPPAGLRAEAVEAAGRASVAVVFAGLADRDESEGFDRPTMSLPGEQIELIRAVAAVAARTVVVLSHGGTVTMEEWHDEVDAIVDGALLGQAGGAAIADVLFGEVNPSGRLAETIPRRVEDTPAWMNFPGEQDHVRYGEGVLVGYRYFATAGVPVRYPFGHGLGYSSFGYRDLRVEAVDGDQVEVAVTVTNTGIRTGQEVVQVYVSTNAGPVLRPLRELRAFEKVTVEPGGSAVVNLTLGRRAFAYYDVRSSAWRVPAGRYRVEVGANALEVLLSAEVELAGDPPDRTLTLDSSVQEWLDHPVVGPLLRAGMAGTAGAGQEGSGGATAALLSMVASAPMVRLTQFAGGALTAEILEQLLALANSPGSHPAGD